MNSKNANELSAEAKELIEFFMKHPDFTKSITATSEYCIFDPDELNHIHNVKDLLVELQRNGNIANFQCSKINDFQLVFIFN